MPINNRKMSLNFPNESRSFDGVKKRIRFWGYDSAIEITFFLETETLRTISPGTDDTESALLEAFASLRPQIYEAAGNAYALKQKGSYACVLTLENFKK